MPLIAIEGLDGSGGTTQVRMLAEALRPQRVVHTTAEPTSGPIGRLIRDALANRVTLGDGVLPYLFAADRQDHLEREIGPRLAAGEVVITDRYMASSLAYQSLAAPLGFIATLNERFRPADLTVFLDLAPEEGLARVESRGLPKDRFETLDTLRAVGAAYGAALALLRQRGHAIVWIDARGAPEDVHARVMAAVGPCLS